MRRRRRERARIRAHPLRGSSPESPGQRGLGCLPRKGQELTEELPHPVDVLTDVGVALVQVPSRYACATFAGPPCPGTGDEDRIESSLPNRSIEMHVDEIETGRRAEVAQQAWLDVLGPERFSQQRIVEQVDLTDREIVRRAPVVVQGDDLAG